MNNYLVLIHKERFLKGLQTKVSIASQRSSCEFTSCTREKLTKRWLKDDAKRLFESSKNERWLYVLNYSRTEHTNKEPETEDMIDGEFGDIKHRNVAVEMAEMEFAEDEGHFQY
ncbi:unnamed protein product [Mytilus edulis]|uniref:Uncharacterized protein n=1 Tax=Mytilus edulis TaxID=6550 RepID=A0A8S3SBG9_MYTED|nr:unnamed protein product [Mytilus edulis]